MTRDPSDRRKFIIVPLTAEQRALAESEVTQTWVHTAIRRSSPAWLVKGLNWDELKQIAAVAICKATTTWVPQAGTTFRDYAWNAVKWEVIKIRVVCGRSASVWREMESTVSDSGQMESDAARIADHRRDCADNPTLHAWCSPDYTEQRRCLDWRSRIVLYLLAVEGWSKQEISETFGASRMRVIQSEGEAIRKLAAFRVRKAKAIEQSKGTNS